MTWFPPNLRIPWQLTFLNFKEKFFLIILDRYSRFICIESMVDCTAHKTILAFLQIFSKPGIPNTIYCNKGSNFLSKTFKQFYINLTISLQFSSLYHHFSNSAVRAVHTLESIMKKYRDKKLGNCAWRIGLIKYLCTPISDSLLSPAEILNQRVYKGHQPFLCDNHTMNCRYEMTTDNLTERKKRNFITTDISLFQRNQLLLKEKYLVQKP